MQTLSKQKIVLTGLPGSGKTRVAHSLEAQFGCQVLKLNETKSDKLENNLLHELTRPGCYDVEQSNIVLNPSSDVLVWCVIDVRAKLPDNQIDWIEPYLKTLLQNSDGVVFSFVESADLEAQAWWSKWLAKSAINQMKWPVVRWMNQRFANNFEGFVKRTQSYNVDMADDRQGLAKIEKFTFPLKRIVLDHLLMGLDSSKQNLNMKILRVKGVLNTYEYDNLVCLEGTAYRWDTFPAEIDVKQSELEVWGVGLDQAWLNQIVQASAL